MKHFQLNPTLPLRNEDSTLYLFRLEQGIREESHDSKTEYLCCSLFNLLLNGFVFHCRRLLELTQCEYLLYVSKKQCELLFMYAEYNS